MSLNYKFIGQQVKNARNKKQISQAELAEQIDISVPYISRIETAVKNVSLEVLVNIANTLGVTVDFLLHGNQTNDLTEYQSALSLLIIDCTSYEKQIIFEVAYATKKSLRDNNCLQYQDNLF